MEATCTFHIQTSSQHTPPLRRNGQAQFFYIFLNLDMCTHSAFISNKLDLIYILGLYFIIRRLRLD